LELCFQQGNVPADARAVSTHALLAKSRDRFERVTLRVDFLKGLDNGCAQFVFVKARYHEHDGRFDYLQTLDHHGVEITFDRGAANFPGGVANGYFISSWRLLISDALSVLVSGLVGPIDRVGQSLVVQRLLLVARRCSLP
jgi:hypothetical protein